MHKREVGKLAQKKKGIYFILALVLFFNYALVFADNTLEDLKKQQKETQQELDKIEKEKKNLGNQMKDVESEIAKLDKQVSDATVELEKVEKDLKILNEDIDKTLEELEEAEEKIGDKQDTFNSRLRVMYKNGDVGYLEVLLAAANIGDFLSRKDMVQSIVNHDVELIKYMKDQRDIINNKKTELQAKRASVEVTRNKLDDRKQELARANRAKRLYMEELLQNDKILEEEEDKLIKFAKEIDSKIVKLQRVEGPYSGGAMQWPVPVYKRISDYFGYRIHPVLKTKKLHTGIDIASAAGNKVVAANDGTVIYSGTLGGYGKTIMIDHGGGIVTLYGHNSSLVVSEGAQVKRGDTIAKIGSTGISTGPHCHFEVRKNGSYVDPMPYLKGD